jgi:hypothetical protein
MQKLQVEEITGYANIGEVRMEVQVASCNRLLADGWVLLGVYPMTMGREMTQEGASGDQHQKQAHDTQRYVRRFVGYVLGRRRE